MRNSTVRLAFAVGASIAYFTAATAAAQHADLLIARDSSGKLVTGTADFDNGHWILGARSFEGELPAVPLVDEPSGIYFEADPGFNARAQADLDNDNPPAGSFLALPALADLRFDIVAPTVNGQAANLFYWDGVGAVNFQPAVGVTLTVSVGLASAAADGTSAVIAGFNLETTDASGAVHRHPEYILDDGTPGTYAPAGIYLLPLAAKMNGLTTSELFTITFAAGEIDEEVHEAALEWVETNVVPEPATWMLALTAVMGLAIARGCTIRRLPSPNGTGR